MPIPPPDRHTNLTPQVRISHVDNQNFVHLLTDKGKTYSIKMMSPDPAHPNRLPIDEQAIKIRDCVQQLLNTAQQAKPNKLTAPKVQTIKPNEQKSYLQVLKKIFTDSIAWFSGKRKTGKAEQTPSRMVASPSRPSSQETAIVLQLCLATGRKLDPKEMEIGSANLRKDAIKTMCNPRFLKNPQNRELIISTLFDIYESQTLDPSIRKSLKPLIEMLQNNPVDPKINGEIANICNEIINTNPEKLAGAFFALVTQATRLQKTEPFNIAIIEKSPVSSNKNDLTISLVYTPNGIKSSSDSSPFINQTETIFISYNQTTKLYESSNIEDVKKIKLAHNSSSQLPGKAITKYLKDNIETITAPSEATTDKGKIMAAIVHLMKGEINNPKLLARAKKILEQTAKFSQEQNKVILTAFQILRINQEFSKKDLASETQKQIYELAQKESPPQTPPGPAQPLASPAQPKGTTNTDIRPSPNPSPTPEARPTEAPRKNPRLQSQTQIPIEEQTGIVHQIIQNPASQLRGKAITKYLRSNIETITAPSEATTDKGKIMAAIVHLMKGEINNPKLLARAKKILEQTAKFSQEQNKVILTAFQILRINQEFSKKDLASETQKQIYELAQKESPPQTPPGPAQPLASPAQPKGTTNTDIRPSPQTASTKATDPLNITPAARPVAAATASLRSDPVGKPFIVKSPDDGDCAAHSIINQLNQRNIPKPDGTAFTNQAEVRFIASQELNKIARTLANAPFETPNGTLASNIIASIEAAFDVSRVQPQEVQGILQERTISTLIQKQKDPRAQLSSDEKKTLLEAYAKCINTPKFWLDVGFFELIAKALDKPIVILAEDFRSPTLGIRSKFPADGEIDVDSALFIRFNSKSNSNGNHYDSVSTAHKATLDSIVNKDKEEKINDFIKEIKSQKNNKNQPEDKLAAIIRQLEDLHTSYPSAFQAILQLIEEKSGHRETGSIQQNQLPILLNLTKEEIQRKMSH